MTKGRKHVNRQKPAFGESGLKRKQKTAVKKVKPLSVKEEAFLRRELGLSPLTKRRSFTEVLNATDAQAISAKESMLSRYASKHRRGSRVVRAVVVSGGAFETNRRKH